MKTISVDPIPGNIFEKLGFYWYKTPEQPHYVADELVVITEEEGNSYYRAAEELYDMYIQAGQYVIDNNLFAPLDIPANLEKIIRYTWEDDRHFHLIGRFDFAGGLDGTPIKLIEFNADTPSMIFEVALIQWMILKHNNLKEEQQFNRLYETLKESFERIKALHPLFDTSEEKIPHALFSCLDAGLEDENTTRLFEEIAYESGYITGFEYAEAVCFDKGNPMKKGGIFNSDGEHFDFWFKLVPYEYIGNEEPELAEILTDIILRDVAVLINPPYSLLFQSKGIMKILWDLYPGHPLLLETSWQPIQERRCVEKKTFSREGNNIILRDEKGNTIEERPGPYESYRSIFQEYAELKKDGDNRLYQAGVFFSYEPCGIGFRRDKGIIHNNSQFVGHLVED